MTAVRNFWILLVLILLRTFVRGDAVLCSLMESCILPCTFEPGNHVLIHWIKQSDIAVHSYYRDKDQLANQNQQFSGRTNLFTDQFQKGNASLRLTTVKLSDQGSYKCYVSTISGNKESAIDLNVEVQPREVSIKQKGNMITCSSEGLFPQPTLTWTSSPSVTLAPDIPSIARPQQELYSIKSSLVIPKSDVDYICTVSTGRNSKMATLHEPTSVSTSGTETTLPCMASNFPSKSLVWIFNNSQNILSRTSSEDTFTATEEWEKYVKSVSESGSLTLHHLTSEQAGTYTCELSTDKDKHIRSTDLTMTKSHVAGIVAGVVVAVVVVAAVTLLIFRKRVGKLFKKKKQSHDHDRGTQEMHLKPHDELLEIQPEAEKEKSSYFDECAQTVLDKM